MACIITPRGVLCEVDRVVPVCETRFEFNGKQRRLVEAADDLRASAPTALVLRFQLTPPLFSGGCVSARELFVGNLRPEQTADIQRTFLTQGYYDFSALSWQEAKRLKDTRCDQGKSLPYTSDYVEDLQDDFLLLSDIHNGDIFAQSPCPDSIFSQRSSTLDGCMTGREDLL